MRSNVVVFLLNSLYLSFYFLKYFILAQLSIFGRTVRFLNCSFKLSCLIFSGNTVELSEQLLLDCTDGSCEGGSITHAMNYLSQKGSVNASAYAYEAAKSFCRRVGKGTLARFRQIRYVTPNDEDSLKKVLATEGPVAVTLQVNIR